MDYLATGKLVEVGEAIGIIADPAYTEELLRQAPEQAENVKKVDEEGHHPEGDGPPAPGWRPGTAC